MKSCKIAVMAFSLISLSDSAYCQLWKQYSDSAKVFNDQKKADKAIEYYYKAKEGLTKDSLWTNSHAGICYNIGALYYNTGQYVKAEPIWTEAKQIREKVLGKSHLDYALSCNSLANLYFDIGQYNKAEVLYEEAKKVREQALGKDHLKYASSCTSLADLYSQVGQYAKAEPLYLEAKSIGEKNLAKEDNSYARNCNNLAVLYWKMGQYEKAETSFLEVKQIWEKILGREHPSYASVCLNLGNLYVKTNQYTKAESLYLESKQIYGKVFGKEHPYYASSCNNLAALYSTLGQYEMAEPFYLESKQIIEKKLGKDHPDYASSCGNLAELYMKMGQYEKAEHLHLEAKQIMDKALGRESPGYATSCNHLAELYMDMGQYAKAEPLFLEAKSIREKVLGKEHPDYAESCNGLAKFHNEMGQYEKAEQLFWEAKKIREKVFGKKHVDYGGSCNNLAVLYLNMGQYEKAETFFLEANQIVGKALGKEHPNYASGCNNLADLYQTMGQYEKAELLYLEAAHIREKVLGKNNPEYATTYNHLGGLYSRMRQFEKAEPLYIEAKQIRERLLGKEHPIYAASCNNLADLYRKVNQYKKSETLFLEAKQILGKTIGNEHPSYAQSCNGLANLYWDLKNYKQAYALYSEAFSSQNTQLKKIFQFTSETEKQSYLRNIADLGETLLSFNTIAWPPSHQDFAYDVSLFNRNLILSSSQQLRNNIYNTTDTNIKNTYDKWINSREQIAFWSVKQITVRPSYVKDLEEQANILEKELTRLSSAFKDEQQSKDVNWQKIKQNLKPNDAAIEFVQFNYYNGKRSTDSIFYIGLVLRKDKPDPILVRLFEKRQLDAILNSHEGLSIDDKVNAIYKQNSSLYNLIWKPLEKHLSGISKIYFASAGSLFKISFAAMPVNDKQVLGDKYQLVQLNTTASVINKNETMLASADKIQLYGGIKYDADSTALKQSVVSYPTSTDTKRSLPDDLKRGAGFQYLPGTQKEADEINKQAATIKIPVTTLKGTNATEESIKALTGKASPSVLHIATHGFFFPDPKDDKKNDVQRMFETSGKVFKQSDNPLFRSGLLFAGANNAWNGKPIEGIEDGILTAYEVSNMYLPNTKLVVLSACETALGDVQGSEGVYGLQRSFKMAGVQNLVMSLWKVPDAETAEFMQLFYKNLFAKQNISDAFHNAQKTMKNKYRNEPYKWAAWVLVR